MTPHPVTSLPVWWRLTCSKQVCDQVGEGVFQVKLQQLDGLQAVCFLLVRRSLSFHLKQGQIFTVLHLLEQLENTTNVWNLSPGGADTPADVLDADGRSYLVVGEEANSLHLMEHRVVAGVDLIPSINISSHQEGVQTRPH